MASDPLLELADSLKSSGFYDDAITEYYRYSFFNPHSNLLDDAYSKIGFCFANMNKWDEAIEAMDRSIFFAQNDSLIEQRKIDQAVVYLASGNTAKAQFYLKWAVSSSAYDDVRDRATMLLFISLILNHNWQTASYTYQSAIKNQLMESALMESTLFDATNYDYKSPAAASLLSTFIPGTGQIYNGRWLTGLNAMALNSALGYLTVNNFITERYISGFLSFMFLFQRYYSGNRYQAYRMTVEHNDMIDSNYEQILLKLIYKNHNPKQKRR